MEGMLVSLTSVSNEGRGSQYQHLYTTCILGEMPKFNRIPLVQGNWMSLFAY